MEKVIALVRRVMPKHLGMGVLSGGLLVALAGGVAVASIPDSGGVINACYNSKSGALRLIDPTTQNCVKGEASLSWNQTGPQGPIGLQGPAGPAGLQGPRGVQGVPGTPLSSVDDLIGLPCTTSAGQGWMGVSYASSVQTGYQATFTCWVSPVKLGDRVRIIKSNGVDPLGATAVVDSLNPPHTAFANQLWINVRFDNTGHEWNVSSDVFLTWFEVIMPS